MKLNQVLITYKKMDEVAKKIPPKNLGPFKRMMKINDDARRSVEDLLCKKGIGFTAMDRDHLDADFRADLIVSIGGDGTFLASCHVARGIPILGVNSMPGVSVGYFCLADKDNFDAVIADVAGDRLRPASLATMDASITGMSIPFNAVNDILFTMESPAEVARYTLKIGKVSEHQKSSGIWISTGAGSTGAMSSAGGRVFSMRSRRLEYLVREPYSPEGRKYKLTCGMIKPGGELHLLAERNAMIFIDGPRITFPIREGESLKVRLSSHTVKAYI
jgi:NAD+ kinase